MGVQVWSVYCTECKFQSHPTIPPGRLNELAFAAVYQGGFVTTLCL